MMWYGVLGTKELLHRTYKNLEQKVLLEVRKHNSSQVDATKGTATLRFCLNIPGGANGFSMGVIRCWMNDNGD